MTKDVISKPERIRIAVRIAACCGAANAARMLTNTIGVARPHPANWRVQNE
jgi:hypothetical protein